MILFGKVIIEYSGLTNIFGFNLGLGWTSKIIVCPNESNPIEINLDKIYSDIQIQIESSDGLLHLSIDKKNITYLNEKPQWCKTKKINKLPFPEFKKLNVLPSVINLRIIHSAKESVLEQSKTYFSFCKIASLSNILYAYCYDDAIFTQMDVNEIIKYIVINKYE